MRISQKVKVSFNAKSSTYFFHVKRKIFADFQICISVPLTVTFVYHLYSVIHKARKGHVVFAQFNS